MIFDSPRLISFSKIGDSSQGFISVSENLTHVPFDVKRIFWTYYTPDNILRGKHAHHNTEMVLIAAAGRIIVNTEMPVGEVNVFILDRPEIGLYIPKYCWHTMQYSHSSVQLVLASRIYDEKDYIRSYEEFKTFSDGAK